MRLLTDGSGPLYLGGDRTLRHAVRVARLALDPLGTTAHQEDLAARRLTSGLRRPLHGQPSSRSSWAATDRSSGSLSGGPTSCAPTGRPSLVGAAGIEIAGWPVMFQMPVNG